MDGVLVCGQVRQAAAQIKPRLIRNHMDLELWLA